MPRTLLIFDLDGTLIDSRSDLATAINLMRLNYGLAPLPVKTVVSYVGDGIRNLVRRSLDGVNADLDEAVGLQRRFYREHMYDETVLYPGVETGLSELNRRGHVLAAASNKQADFCESILEHFGILRLFAHVAGDGQGLDIKPNPGMFLAIMNRSGASAVRTWAVGDNHTDLEAARHAGVRSVFLTCGFGTMGGEKADKVCASFDEVVALFPA